MTAVEVVALLVVVTIVSAAVGAAVTVAVVFLGKHGETERFEALLEPIRTAQADVIDRVESWSRRDVKRARDAARSTRNEDQPPPGGAEADPRSVEPRTTRERMIQLARRIRRGVPG